MNFIINPLYLHIVDLAINRYYEMYYTIALKEDARLIQLIVSIILFFVMFFGISFILNMLLRQTWFMSFIYPIIVLFIVDNLSTLEYFKRPGYAFRTAFSNLLQITPVDIIILISGFLGTIVAGIVMKFLRKSGYQMF